MPLRTGCADASGIGGGRPRALTTALSRPE